MGSMQHQRMKGRPDKSSRKCWADLVDSDEEELPGPLPMGANNDTANRGEGHDATEASESNRGQQKSSKVCWADMQDSDDDGAQIMPKGTQQRTGNAISNGAPFAEPAAVGSNRRRDVDGQDSLKRRQRRKGPGKKANAESSEGSSSAVSQSQLNRMDASRSVGKGFGKGLDKVAVKQVGKGAGKSGARFSNAATKGVGKRGSGKLQCQFTIGIEEDSKFRVVRRVIGNGGENMKRIAEETGAKLRLRGRGSKFLEGPEQQESTDDLMLCISGQTEAGFDHAKKLVAELLLDIYDSFNLFCSSRGEVPPPLGIQLHEGYRAGSR